MFHSTYFCRNLFQCSSKYVQFFFNIHVYFPSSKSFDFLSVAFLYFSRISIIFSLFSFIFCIFFFLPSHYCTRTYIGYLLFLYSSYAVLSFSCFLRFLISSLCCPINVNSTFTTLLTHSPILVSLYYLSIVSEVYYRVLLLLLLLLLPLVHKFI